MNKNKYFDEIIKMLFGIEGGYVNDPDDMGGPTNYGITQDTFDAWRKINNQPRGSVKTDLTQKEAKDIYYNMFWKESGAEKYDDPRDAMIVFDMAVNSGPQEAKRIFKKSNENFYEMLKSRKNYYDDIIKNKPNQKKYAEGWYNRLNILENNANKMIEQGIYTPNYYNESTPFDANYKGNLQPVQSEVNTEANRNKYQYYRNKAVEKGYIKPINETNINNQTIKAPKSYQEWLEELRRKRKLGKLF